MIDSPLLKEMIQDARQEDILGFLEARFGSLEPTTSREVQSVSDDEALRELTRAAARCASLTEFAQQLRAIVTNH